MEKKTVVIPKFSLDDQKRIQAMSEEEKRRIIDEYEKKLGMFSFLIGKCYAEGEVIYIMEICLRENVPAHNVEYEGRVYSKDVIY